MTSYTTAQLDQIIAKLQAALAGGYLEVTGPDGDRVVYRSEADIRSAIAYFSSLYKTASDAPVNPVRKIRNFFMFGGKGIGF